MSFNSDWKFELFSDRQDNCFIEGIENETLFTVLAILMIVPSLTYYLFRNSVFRHSAVFTRTNNEQHNPPSDDRQVVRRRYERTNECPICPICLNEQIIYPLETNCGHVYCGVCLLSMYSFQLNDDILFCPLCRQMITLLYTSHTMDRQPMDNNRLTNVLRFVIQYNRRFSGQPRALMDQITDMPNMLRHLWNDFFSVGGLMRVRFKLRVLFCLMSAVLYLFLPQDIFPETVFGLFGFLDDFCVIGFVIVYLAVIYRNAIANEEFDNVVAI